MSVNTICTEGKKYGNSGKDEKADVGGEISECGKYRQISSNHPAFLI